jgi:hypothetical protein
MTDPIQRLREAHEAATPGPWSARAVEEAKDAWWSVDGPGADVALTDAADAHAIVLAHNALPALLDIAEAAQSAEQDVAWAFGVITRLAWPGSVADLFALHGLPSLTGEYEQARANIPIRRAALDRLEEVGS